MIEAQSIPCSILLTGQQEIKEETDADPVTIIEKHITSTPQKKYENTVTASGNINYMVRKIGRHMEFIAKQD